MNGGIIFFNFILRGFMYNLRDRVARSGPVPDLGNKLWFERKHNVPTGYRILVYFLDGQSNGGARVHAFMSDTRDGYFVARQQSISKMDLDLYEWIPNVELNKKELKKANKLGIL